MCYASFADLLYSNTETCVGFEGPEKKLEIRFNVTKGKGLRAVSQGRWQEILDAVKCTIISCTKNEYLDSYVLSESSLFVYSNKILIKTCGTTTLLHCVSGIQALAKEFDAEINMIIFSRKSLNFPSRQLYPHNNFDDEVCFPPFPPLPPISVLQHLPTSASTLTLHKGTLFEQVVLWEGICSWASRQR